MRLVIPRNILIPLVGLSGFLFVGLPIASAQINMAALAQFKQNQQAALTRQLQGNAASNAGEVRKSGKRGKGKADAPSVVSKPPLIKAQTRSFKGNFSDMRKSNVR